MAIHAPITGAPPRAILLPTADTPLGRILAQFDRLKLEAAIEVMIGLLDVTDGDPEDHQANGDELDGTGGEDDFIDRSSHVDGAGCPISDPGEDEDSPTDTAWIEQVDQTARQPYRARGATVEDQGTGEAIGVLEDAEEDDAAEDDGQFLWGGMNGRLRAWGSPSDDACTEETLQPAVMPDAAANDA